MGVVVGPDQVVDQVVLACEVDAGLVFLEGGEAVAAEGLAGKGLELGVGPHVMHAVGLVHGLEEPGEPADAGFNGGEANAGEALDHARGAELDEGLGGGDEGMDDHIDDGAAVAVEARGSRPVETWKVMGRPVSSMTAQRRSKAASL